MLRKLAAAVLFLLTATATAARADVPVTQLMAERLTAGETTRLEQELSARLAASPTDDQLRFALGAAQFIATVENERFDNNQNGLLRFDFTLVVDAKKSL